jgi:ATP-dependent helicase HrpB
VIGGQIELLPWTPAARQLQARAALLGSVDPAFPDISDAALSATVQDWLAPHLLGVGKLSEVAERLDLCAVLRGVLGWEAAARLDRDLPMELHLPGGLRARSGVLWGAGNPRAGVGPDQVAGGVAVAGRAAGGHYIRSGGVLARGLGGCAERYARALPKT